MQQHRRQQQQHQQQSDYVRDTWLSKISTVFSMVNTLIVVVGGGTLLFSDITVATWNPEGLIDFLQRPNTDLQSALFLSSTLYYCVDIIILFLMLYRHGRTGLSRGKRIFEMISTSWPIKRDLGFILHHAFCLLGLCSSMIHRSDATLILLGFTIGEVSNPPRILVTLSGLFPRYLDSIRRHTKYLTNTHLLLFIATRVLLAKYLSSLVSRYAKLYTTIISALGILMISFIALSISIKGSNSKRAFIV
mmetsp:Transcript_26922/g.43292  ORF Transcript_26922/g.43292 Transcript_26922/m.43292 type:complete len:248 (-) Transcript_26922:68-811(-)